MAALAKTDLDKLPELKKKTEDSRNYFKDNIDRFNEYMKFVFKSSMTEEADGVNQDIGMPNIEFNIVEAYVSKLRGEFAKQQPSLSVRAADGVPISMLTPDFTELIDILEAHLRAIFFDGSNDKLEYNVYSDGLSGGFSVMRVFTHYVNEMSFEQNIGVERVFDPTMCGFDPLARESHKGDGGYCYELYPLTKEQFIEQFGEAAAQDIKFSKSNSGFDWSYKNGAVEIVLVCDFYEKQRKREKLLKLANGHTVTEKEYNKFLKRWEESGNLAPPLQPVNARETFIETIVRYRFCEHKLLKKDHTDFKYLPLVFIDGNSVNLNEGGESHQMTRPYIYHAKGIQRLKNLAGQSMGNELENMVQHKLIAALESIPVEYQDPYRNFQKADVIIYKHFLDPQNPDVTLPPPREVVRTPIPPQIMETFRVSDEMTQTILGSYDGAAAMQQAPLSGIAFARGAIQSNNASLPYVVGYIKGINRVAQIILDLIPKYYRTPRSLPILRSNGDRSYVEINKKGSLYMNYDPNTLQVKVEVGVNFAMQKEIALQTIIALMQASPLFNEFMNQNGLQILLDNIEIRGIEELKQKAAAFEKQLQEQKEMESQLTRQQQMIEMAQAKKLLQSPTETEVAIMAIQEKAQNDAANTAIKERAEETEFLKVLSQIRSEDVTNELTAAKVEAENARTAVQGAIEISKHISELGESNDEANNED